MSSNIIKFVHEDQIVEIKNPDPNEILLNYIRTNLKKTGTKASAERSGPDEWLRKLKLKN